MPLSRREFLKLSVLLPLFGARSPYFFGAPTQRAENPEAPNVLILLFDTLSAYHISLYGYRRETMPNLARFAERATVYHQHYAAGNFTTPGTASLLTGVYPWTHRAIRFSDTVAPQFVNQNLFGVFGEKGYYRIAYTHNPLTNTLLRQMRAGLETLKPLQELFLDTRDFWVGTLLANDYDTASISRAMDLQRDDGFAGSLFLSKLYESLQEKHRKELDKMYGEAFPRGIPNVDENYFLLEHAIDWIQRQLTDLPHPFLAYFHLMPPHDPYLTRQEFVDRFDDGWVPTAKPEHPLSQGAGQDALVVYRRAYDEYIAYADAEFGRLYDAMQEAGVLDNTWVVFTSDHGELFERGILGHANRTLYEPLIRVPLLISQPGQQARTDIHVPTSCIDLLPTLLHATGQPVPDWCEGEILPPYRADEANPEREIFALEAKGSPKYGALNQATASMIKGEYKVTYYFGYPEGKRLYEFYDLQKDPEELEDLFDEKGSLAEEYLDTLLEKIRSVG